MSKTVQIPEDLFFDLCRYHLAADPSQGPDGGEETEELLEAIEKGLQDKLEAMIRRELYSRYKNTSLTEKERQEARRAYLDRVGMGQGYRWDSLEPPL